MVDDIVFLLLSVVLLVPATIMFFIICFSLCLDVYENLILRYRKLREKNYCKNCGVVIPKGEDYCFKCLVERL